jgi:hypothetical protein
MIQNHSLFVYYFIIFPGLVWTFAGSNTIESDVWSPRNHDTFWYPLNVAMENHHFWWENSL